jgi:hypothetical protein
MESGHGGSMSQGGGMSNGSSIGHLLDSRGSMSNGSYSGSSIGHLLDSDGGLVYADGVLVNDGGIDDVVDGVDLVGLGDSVGLGNLNGVGLGNMFVDDDLSLNGSGHWDGDLDGVSVYLKLGFDATNLRGDLGVGADGSSNSLDGDGVSGGGSLVGGCGRDSSIRCGSSRDGWGSNGDSDLRGLGGTSNISVGSGLADRLFLRISKAGLDGLGANLDLTVSDNFVVSLSDSGASMDMFLHTVSYNGRSSMHSMCHGGGVQKRGGMVVGAGLAKSHKH